MENANKGARLSHIDDARSLVIFLVVLVHASVTYSGLGGWYVIETDPASLSLLSKVAFGLFNSFNQAWFMGILFFFGGYFASDGLSRKTVKGFAKDRLKRLGIPLAGFVFVVNPLVLYYLVDPYDLGNAGNPAAVYVGKYIGEGWFLQGTGPLWFAETLLIFSLALALVRAISGRCALRGLGLARPQSEASARDASAESVPSARAPSVRSLVALILVTAIAAFSIRLVFPIGTSVLNLQFCYFASYIALFAFGARGHSCGWFLSLTSGKGERWLYAAFAGIAFWALIMVFGGPLQGDLNAMNGGLNLTSAAYALWESFTAVAMSVGITAFLANRRKEPGALSRFLSRNSFSVYVFHPVFLIGLTRILFAWRVAPLPKALAVGLLAYALSSAFAELVVRRIPWARKYF
jgi:glucans biosynthesis protein C